MQQIPRSQSSTQTFQTVPGGNMASSSRQSDTRDWEMGDQRNRRR